MHVRWWDDKREEAAYQTWVQMGHVELGYICYKQGNIISIKVGSTKCTIYIHQDPISVVTQQKGPKSALEAREGTDMQDSKKPNDHNALANPLNPGFVFENK